MTSVGPRESKPSSAWRWAVAAFALHSLVVASLIRIRDLNLGNSVFFVAKDTLRIAEFWVYHWVFEWFNTPVLAKPMYEVNRLLGLSTERASSEFYEWCMLSIFGGVVYAGVAIAWLSWRRRKLRLNVIGTAAV
jgi:hypothetical protein